MIVAKIVGIVEKPVEKSASLPRSQTNELNCS